jgi:hypothetical protein
MSAPFKTITATLTPSQYSYAVVNTATLTRSAEPQDVKLVITRSGAISVHFDGYADWPTNVVSAGQITAFDAHTSAHTDAPITRYLIPSLAWDMATQLADDAREEVPA